MSEQAIIQERNAEFMRALIRILYICEENINTPLRGAQDLIEAVVRLRQIRKIVLDLFMVLDYITENGAQIEGDAQDDGAQDTGAQIASNATQLQN